MPQPASSTASWGLPPSIRSPSSTRSAAAGAATRASRPPNHRQRKGSQNVPNTIALPKKPLVLGLAGAAAMVALLALTLGSSTQATAAPTAQKNIVSTAAAAGEFKTLLALAKQ